MIDVVCFCGCAYSFSGDMGACPKCGEYVTFSQVPMEEERRMRRELDAVLHTHDGLDGAGLTPSRLAHARADLRGA
jgi:predicted ATP-dependent serine protease